MGKDVIIACDFSSAEKTFEFLDKIYIPDESKDIFNQFLHINPTNNLPYEIGDKFINPLTGNQLEILILDYLKLKERKLDVFHVYTR